MHDLPGPAAASALQLWPVRPADRHRIERPIHSLPSQRSPQLVGVRVRVCCCSACVCIRCYTDLHIKAQSKLAESRDPQRPPHEQQAAAEQAFVSCPSCRLPVGDAIAEAGSHLGEAPTFVIQPRSAAVPLPLPPAPLHAELVQHEHAGATAHSQPSALPSRTTDAGRGGRGGRGRGGRGGRGVQGV